MNRCDGSLLGALPRVSWQPRNLTLEAMADDNPIAKLVAALGNKCPRCGNEITLKPHQGEGDRLYGAMPKWGSDRDIPDALVMCMACGCGLSLGANGQPRVIDRLPGR